MNTFKDLMEDFYKEILALKTSMPLSVECFSHLLDENYKLFRIYLKEHCEITKEESDGKFSYSVPQDQITKYRKFESKLSELVTAINILPRMYIVTLICQYDAFIGNLIRLVLIEKPEILNSSEKTLTFQQITQIGSIDSAKEYIIEKEIESVLRKSHDDHLKWFETKLGIKLHEDKVLLRTFFEITERRNLFAHNNGEVNDSYIDNCEKLNCWNNRIKKGDQLDVDPTYYANSVNCILELSIKLGTIIWRHLKPDENKQSEQTINNIAFEFIKRKDYNLAITLIDFALTCFKPFTNSSTRMMLSINLAQCYLWKKEASKSKEIIDSLDWSLCPDSFILVRKVLERKFDEAVKMLETQKLDIKKEELLEWPVFMELREQKCFKDFFVSAYSITIEDQFKNNTPELLKAVITISDKKES
jgi:hypothetical protein